MMSGGDQVINVDDDDDDEDEDTAAAAADIIIIRRNVLEGKSSSCCSRRKRVRVVGHQHPHPHFHFDETTTTTTAAAPVVKKPKMDQQQHQQHQLKLNHPSPNPKPPLCLQLQLHAQIQTQSPSPSPASASASAAGIREQASSAAYASESHDAFANNIEEDRKRRIQLDSLKDLHLALRPNIAQLCQLLCLSEQVKDMVERFHEYFMNNHTINTEPETILQAFQISLCWCAASLVNHEIDHKESLALAKQHLGFTCTKKEADFVHAILRCLKGLFRYRTGYSKAPNSPKASEVSNKAVGRDCSDATSYQQSVEVKTEGLLGFQEGSDIQIHTESGVASEFQLAQKDLLESINDIEEKFDKRMAKLLEKQNAAMKQFNQKCEDEKAQLEDKKRTEAAIVRLLSSFSMISCKLKKLDVEYARKFDEHRQKMDEQLKDLEALQLGARTKVQERKTRWVEAVKCWARVELVKPPVSEVNLSEGMSSAGNIQSLSESEVEFSKTLHIVPDEIMSRSDPGVYRVTSSAIPYKEKSQEPSVEDGNLTVCSVGAEEQAVEAPSCKNIPDAATSSNPNGEVSSRAAEDVSFREDQENHALQAYSSEKVSDRDTLGTVRMEDPLTVCPVGAEEQAVEAPSCKNIPDAATLSNPNGEVPSRAAEDVSFCEDQENFALQAYSSGKVSDGNTLRTVRMEGPSRESVTIISCEGEENLNSFEASSTDASNLSKVDGRTPLREPVIAFCGEDQENFGSAEAPSSEKNPDGVALSVADGVFPSSAPEAVSSSEGQENIMSTIPSSEKNPDGVALSVADGVFPSSALEAVSSSEGQENIMSTIPSSEKSIPEGATLNVSDGDVPKSTSEMPTSSHGMDSFVCMNPSSSKEQIPYTAALSMPAEEVCLAEPETDPSEALEGGRVDRENDGTSAIVIDPRGGIECTTNKEPDIDEQSVAALSSVQHVPTTNQRGPLPTGQESANLDSPLSASSALQARTATENQPSKEGQTANQNPQAPRQPLANFNELFNQDIVQPPQSPNDVTIGGLGTCASEERIASIPSVYSGLPVQTAPVVSSHMPQPLYHDPLQNEMERISKERDQTVKIYEDSKLQLKSECEKEIEEAVAKIRSKYEVKLQEKEAEFLLQTKEHDLNSAKVRSNQILAYAFRFKCKVDGSFGSAGAQQGTSSSLMQHPVQLSSQQPFTASTLPSVGSAAITIETVAAAIANAQTMGPPLHAVHPSVYPSGTPPRPPHISSISGSAGNLHMGSAIRAPAPHLQPFRPSTFISPTGLPSHSRGISNQQGHSNCHVASPSLLQAYSNPPVHRPSSTTCQFDRIQTETARGLMALPNSSLPSLDVLMGMNNLSGGSAYPSSNFLHGTFIHQESSIPSIRSNPAQQSGAPDIICLSDDD